MLLSRAHRAIVNNVRTAILIFFVGASITNCLYTEQITVAARSQFGYVAPTLRYQGWTREAAIITIAGVAWFLVRQKA